MSATRLVELPVRQRNTPCCAPVVPARLTGEEVAKHAAQLKAAGDPSRLAMLDLIAQQATPICVCDISARFDQNQPTISHHLRILREAGLVETEKRGLWSYYWATEAGRRLLALLEGLETQPERNES